MSHSVGFWLKHAAWCTGLNFPYKGSFSVVDCWITGCDGIFVANCWISGRSRNQKWETWNYAEICM